jgi:hypothetical protein
MKGLDKKSNSQLLELRVKLSQDFELVRSELIQKYDHWRNIEKVYLSVLQELKNRNIDVSQK